jgi:hypothetical protein
MAFDTRKKLGAYQATALAAREDLIVNVSG